MDIINRYDEDFFNCMMGHVVSYLKQSGVPVELVFYNVWNLHKESIRTLLL
jgi:hypothetical protein